LARSRRLYQASRWSISACSARRPLEGRAADFRSCVQLRDRPNASHASASKPAPRISDRRPAIFRVFPGARPCGPGVSRPPHFSSGPFNIQRWPKGSRRLA
jgi:hypothetical protein